jgi:pimeloyl-ACP methyl ester carboxylesterase
MDLAVSRPMKPGLSSAVVAVAILLAACSTPLAKESAVVPSPSISSATPTPEPTAEPTPDLNEISAMFDIGGGRELYLQCAGNGSPTILLEAGDESGSWWDIAPELIQQTRTCAYDRAGNGRSVDATGCRQLDDLLGDLEALLEVAEVDPPYLLVGGSGGGYLMAGLAARRPADVAGLVLVETPKAITIMSPELEAAISCDAPNNVEHRDYYAVEHAVWDNRALIGDFPMTIISNDYGDSAPPGDEETNVEDQRGWLVLSPNSNQVVVTSGHLVEPGLIVDEILAVLEAAQQR